MHNLHYFNPGHETSVFQGKTNITPSRNVQKMTHDLTVLPMWYANNGDFILTESASLIEMFLPLEIIPSIHLTTPKLLKEEKKLIPPLKATPWGISPAALHYLQQIKKITGVSLDIPVWQESLKELTGRQTAAVCLQEIKETLPHLSFPKVPLFTDKIEKIESYLKKQPGSYILKMPYSSSGRGLLWITGNSLSGKDKEWVKGTIRKQGCISIEPVLKKIHDFGWEFLSDGKGTIHYAGISPFQTNEKGSFTGNNLRQQPHIQQDIFNIISPNLYDEILETTIIILQKLYGYLYEGCIGVDIMIYQDETGNYLLHPCVEINMRYTMGYLALKLAGLLTEDATGSYQLTYTNNSIALFQQHLQMEKEYPLQIKKGKIRKGYLSLCPVTSETNYKAFILIK